MPPGKRIITEDDPRWEPRTMGDKKYGNLAQFPSNGGGTHRLAGRGTGPGPKGSYPKARVGTAIQQRQGQTKPEIIRAAANRLAGAKASGKTKLGKMGIGIERKGVGRGFPPGKNKRVY